MIVVLALSMSTSSRAQTVRVQNGTTVQISDGNVLDLEGGTMDLGGSGETARLEEQTGGRVTNGELQAVRELNTPSAANVAGLGAELSASADLGTVTVTRGHVAQSLDGDDSIQRYFSIDPSGTNSGLSATLTVQYADAELNGVDESTLELFRSTDGGASWTAEGQDARNAETNEVQLDGISSFSRWTLGGEPSFPHPTNLTADAATAEISLNWDGIQDPELQRYRIYRDTDPIFEHPSNAAPFDSVGASSTSFLDNPPADERYYYRVTAVSTSRGESTFSNEESAFLYPQEVQAQINRSFGAAADSTHYRLVAMPGEVDRPLSDAIGGQAGTDWQAFLDDGSDEDFFVRFDGSEPFTFRPGTGFWLTATNDWTVDETVQTVDLRGDSVATIPVREGWNVISNPTGKNVAWSRVEAQIGDPLQPIFGFDGAFVQPDTFRSARSGEAYYFFNDEADRDSLVIPYPGAVTPKSVAKSGGDESPVLAVSARSTSGDGPGSTVHVGIDENATRRVGPEDVIAPPGRFEDTSLRLVAPGERDSNRGRVLMTDRRPPASADAGHTFQLRLTSQTNGSVELTAEHLEAVDARSVALLHPEAGTSYDLTTEGAVQIETKGRATDLALAVGTDEYVKDETEAVVPSEVKLSAFPNPVRTQGTLEFTLPTAASVTLRVYDVLGREVTTLTEGRRTAGRHTVRLEADRLSSGVYFGRLHVGNQTRTHKFTVVR